MYVQNFTAAVEPASGFKNIYTKKNRRDIDWDGQERSESRKEMMPDTKTAALAFFFLFRRPS